MYKLESKNKKELSNAISIAILKYLDCVIEIKNINNNSSVYLISAKINNNTILISICAGGKSIGNTMGTKDYYSVDMCISKYIEKLKYDENTLVSVQPKVDADEAETYEDVEDDNCEDIEIKTIIDSNGYTWSNSDPGYTYFLKHKYMLSRQDPIDVQNLSNALVLFNQFLDMDECDTIVFSFNTKIEDLDHTFMMDLVIDKIYTGNRILLSFIIQRPDAEEFMDYLDPSDSIIEYVDNDLATSINRVTNEFETKMNFCYVRCCTVANNEDTYIFAYCNQKLKL